MSAIGQSGKRPHLLVRIKEKWGELRFNYGGGDEVCREVVDTSVELSLTTCEVCGDLGELVGERWFGVRCVAHIDWSPDPPAEESEEDRDDG